MEVLIVAGLAALALFPLALRANGAGWKVTVVLGGTVLLWGAAALTYREAGQRRVASQLELERSIPREERPEEFVTSDTCRACHPSEYASWHGSFHRTMTQKASPASVVGDFDEVSLELDGVRYDLRRREEQFFIEMPDPDSEEEPPDGVAKASSGERRVEKQVGLLTGSHHMQVYWVPSRHGNLQHQFPLSYLIPEAEWVPVRDTFLKDPELPPANPDWNFQCIRCHAVGGQQRPDPRTGAPDTRVGELSIACEACHGPAKAHVERYRNPYSRYADRFDEAADDLIVDPLDLPHERRSEVCGQCHGIKWTFKAKDWAANGFRYRPGDVLAKTSPIIQPTRLAEQPWMHRPLQAMPEFMRERFWADGMVRISGREYNGLLETPCFQRGELSCMSCHSMHKPTAMDDQLAAGMESNQACLGCHENFADDLEAHTHHSPGSSASLCYNCHMPHTTYGLLKAIRSHQIDSPNVLTDLRTGRPNACNLCHLDQTRAWTAGFLEEWHGIEAPSLPPQEKALATGPRWLLTGDAGQRALVAWHAGWHAARTAAGETWQAPLLAQLLDDPYPAVRIVALRALRKLPGFVDSQGGARDYSFTLGEKERIQARAEILAWWKTSGAVPPPEKRARLLFSSAGELLEDKVLELWSRRDNRSMDLQE